MNFKRHQLVIFLVAVGLAWSGAGVAVKRLGDRDGAPMPGAPRVFATIPGGTGPLAIAAGEGFVWAIFAEGLARIDPNTHELTPVDPAPDAVLLAAPTALAIGACGVWETHAFFKETGVLEPTSLGGAAQEPEPTGEWALVRLDAHSGAVRAQVRFHGGVPLDVAVDGDAVWVASGEEGTGHGRIVRVDARSAKVLATIPFEADSPGVAVGVDAVWVSAAGGGKDANAVLRVDPRSNRIVARIGIGTPPGSMIVGGGSVWVGTLVSGGQIMRIDPSANRVAGDVAIIDPAGMDYALGRVWVTTSDGGRLAWFDPESLRVEESARIARNATALAVEEDGTAWVADIERDRVVRVDVLGRERPPERPEPRPCASPTPAAAGSVGVGTMRG